MLKGLHDRYMDATLYLLSDKQEDQVLSQIPVKHARKTSSAALLTIFYYRCVSCEALRPFQDRPTVRFSFAKV
jgi:hypothetical protein